MSIKREMLKAIHDGCPALQDEPEKQQEILAKYKKFGDQVRNKLFRILSCCVCVKNLFDFCNSVTVYAH